MSPTEFLFRRRATDVLLDVRTPAEFAGGHLEGARNVDFLASGFADAVAPLDRDATYYLYCRSGNRSGQAAQRMKAMGFADVHNIGGFDALAGAGAETSR